MSNPNQSNTAFVDYGEGNDNTAELDNPNLKFKTFDAAYIAIDNLGFEREVYIISLGFGNYLMDLEIYGGFSVESTNEIDGLTPLILISEKVKLFKGLIINDVTLYMPLPSNRYKDSLDVDGVEWSTSVNYIFEVVDIDIDIYKKDTSKLNNMIESNKKILSNINNNNIKIISNKSDVDIINIIKPLLKNRTEFIEDAKGIINLILLNTDITDEGIYSLLENTDKGKAILSSFDMTSREFVTALIERSSEILFYTSDTNEQSWVRSAIDNVNSAWTYVKNIFSVDYYIENDLNKLNILFENFNMTYNRNFIDENIDNTFVKFVDFPTQEYINKNIELDIDNKAVLEICELIKNRITTRINNSRQNAINRLGFDVDNLPLISCLDSNIGARDKDEFHNIKFSNTLEYMIDNSNIPGFILEDDSLNPHATYPIINVSEKEGGNIRKGSKFTRYKVIQENYTHDREDGVVFLVNAKNNNIKIIIPEEVNGNNDIWKGRNIIYKRIDRSNNKVYIINKRGKFDGIDSCVELKSCKKSSLKIMIAENGNSYIFE